MIRTPPSCGRSSVVGAIKLIVFEKNQGTQGATYFGRLIERVRIHLIASNGHLLPDSYVRYSNQFFKLHKPKEFEVLRIAKTGKAGLIYGPQLEDLSTRKSLRHLFIFEDDMTYGRTS